jgi:hypothetical protein
VVFLEKVVFKDQCLLLGSRHDPIERRDSRDKVLDPDPKVFLLLKVRPHPIAQDVCFANVKDPALAVAHEIDAGLCRHQTQARTQVGDWNQARARTVSIGGHYRRGCVSVLIERTCHHRQMLLALAMETGLLPAERLLLPKLDAD